MTYLSDYLGGAGCRPATPPHKWPEGESKMLSYGTAKDHMVIKDSVCDFNTCHWGQTRSISIKKASILNVSLIPNAYLSPNGSV